MDVEDALRESLEERCADQAHESGEAHQVHRAGGEQIRERAVVGGAVTVVARLHEERLDAGIARTLQSRRIRSIRNHECQRSVEAPRRNRVDDRLQIGTAPRNQDA
jgi:hypothetical protein